MAQVSPVGARPATGASVEVTARDGRRFEAFVELPRDGHGPGLVLCHATLGLGPALRRAARLFADEGYVVLAPDLSRHLRPHAACDRASAPGEHDRNATFDAPAALSDLRAAAAALRDLPAFRGRIGVLGEGPGGRLAALAAANGDFDCAVGRRAVGVEQVLDRIAATRVPIALHFAPEDPHVPARTLEAIRARLGDCTDVEIHVDSSVADPSATGQGRQASATMMHSRTIALLRRVLGPRYDLSALWETHRACEFDRCDVDATLATMIDEPYVNHVPTMTGGYGREALRRFYGDHFIGRQPRDLRTIPVSRTVGADRVVNEVFMSFTHDCEIEWMLPGVPPTGRRVEVVVVGIIAFRGDRLMHEHLYWDQGSVLLQLGLIDGSGLPVFGAQAARKVLDPGIGSNALPRVAPEPAIRD